MGGSTFFVAIWWFYKAQHKWDKDSYPTLTFEPKDFGFYCILNLCSKISPFSWFLPRHYWYQILSIKLTFFSLRRHFEKTSPLPSVYANYELPLLSPIFTSHVCKPCFEMLSKMALHSKSLSTWSGELENEGGGILRKLRLLHDA